VNSTCDRLIIFDIDGTLLLSGPVARELFLRAFEEVFELTADPRDLSFAGRCDRGVVSLLLQRANASQKLPASFSRFARRYASLMREVYPTAKGPHLLPGVKELLFALREDPSVLLLIGSGNLPETARVKLARFGLDSFFEHGVYGDHHEERTALFAAALTLARETMGWSGARERAWVVGDTVSDVEAAQKVGVKSLAVATGPTAAGDLRRARPDALFADLSSLEDVIGTLVA
jgi:phosphoglycolate phosphatase-like HAD superfamily hydrolase